MKIIGCFHFSAPDKYEKLEKNAKCKGNTLRANLGFNNARMVKFLLVGFTFKMLGVLKNDTADSKVIHLYTLFLAANKNCKPPLTT